MRADTLLSRLDKVRQTGPDSWSARCPAHTDKTNSLSIRQADDKTLIHCFAGCSVHEVVGAVGLEISDLFPPREHHGKPERRPLLTLAGFRAVSFECVVVATIGRAMLLGKLSEHDQSRLVLAVERICAAVSACDPVFRGVKHG